MDPPVVIVFCVGNLSRVLGRLHPSILGWAGLRTNRLPATAQAQPPDFPALFPRAPAPRDLPLQAGLCRGWGSGCAGFSLKPLLRPFQPPFEGSLSLLADSKPPQHGD